MQNMKIAVRSLNTGEEIWVSGEQLSLATEQMIAKDVNFAIKNNWTVVKFEITWGRTPYQEIQSKLFWTFYKLESFDNDVATCVPVTTKDMLLRQDAWEEMSDQLLENFAVHHTHPHRLVFSASFNSVDFETLLPDGYKRVAEHETDDIVFVLAT